MTHSLVGVAFLFLVKALAVVLLRFVSLSKQRLENEMRSLKSASFNFFVVKPDIQATFAPCKHAM